MSTVHETKYYHEDAEGGNILLHWTGNVTIYLVVKSMYILKATSKYILKVILVEKNPYFVT